MGLTTEVCKGNRVPVCPHCGAHEGEWWGCGLTRKDVDLEISCGECGQQYIVVLRMKPVFDTRPLKRGEGK